MDVEKLVNAIDGATATVEEKAQAKSLLQKAFDNKLVRAALEGFLHKYVTGG
jgi:hypothetical protein